MSYSFQTANLILQIFQKDSGMCSIHLSVINFIFFFLLNLTRLVTSKVLKKVTIGFGAFIQSSYATARLVSLGATSFDIMTSHNINLTILHSVFIKHIFVRDIVAYISTAFHILAFFHKKGSHHRLPLISLLLSCTG